MGFENINLWFAKDDNDITVLAKDITKDIKHNNYKCPICGSAVIPRTGEIKTWHFAHRDASKCSTESFIHFWVKHELLKIGDTFKVKMNNEVKEYTCKELLIEQKYETSYGAYKPDLTIITYNNETLYIEVAHTNKKKMKDFIKMWNELNNTVIEITTGEVSDGNKIECMNAIWYNGYEYHEQLKELREVGNKEKEKYNFTKEQIDKINWLINDIVKYNNGIIEIDQLSDEIQAIEDEDSRELVCNIIRNKKCGTILEDYVEYNIKITKKMINENNYGYKFKCKETRLLYERVFCGCDIEIFYKNICCNNGFCFYRITDFKDVLNWNSTKILYGKLVELIKTKITYKEYDIKYFKNSYGESIFFKGYYIDLSNDEVAYEKVNELIDKDIELNNKKYEYLEYKSNNEKWLNTIDEIKYIYSKINNVFSIYYKGFTLYTINNVKYNDLYIDDITNILYNRIKVIDYCEEIKQKLNKIINEQTYFKNIFIKVNFDISNFNDIYIELYINEEYSKILFCNNYMTTDSYDMIATNFKKQLNDIIQRYSKINKNVEEIKNKLDNIKNEYNIKIYYTYFVIENLSNNTRKKINFKDIKDINNIHNRKVFKNVLNENLDFFIVKI